MNDAQFQRLLKIREKGKQARAAQAIEARRAATGTGAVHESAVTEGDAPETTQVQP